jgi:prepilin-type N-terminal cleavage/methylation domain-containing protein
MDARAPGRSGERGLSLLEVLVAMFLLALMVLGLAASVPLALRGVALAGAQTALVLAARDALELARDARPESRLALDTGGFVAVPGHPALLRSIQVAMGRPTAGTATVTVVVRRVAGEGPIEATGATVVGQ